MAAELEISGPSGATIYAIVRRHSDAQAWDVTNATFEAWDDGSIGDYDIPLTDKSGDLYQADFPTDIDSGTRVRVSYYKQAGGSPATSDTHIKSEDYVWDGSGLSGSGSVTLVSGALATLEEFKRHLNISVTTYDDTLRQFLNQITARIQKHTGRTFASTAYAEWHKNCDGPILVKNYPIIYADKVSASLSNGLNVSYSGSDVAARVSVYSSGVRLYSIAADGTETTNQLTFASNPTLSTMATAISAVSGWTGTKVPSSDHKANSLAHVNGFDAKNQTAVLEFADDDDTDYQVDHEGGVIRGSFSGLVFVDYTGGYASIPDDVTMVACEIGQEAWDRAKLNVAASSESMGDYSASVVGKIDFNKGWRDSLAAYTEIV
jgi:hypothetical protein